MNVKGHGSEKYTLVFQVSGLL